MSTYVTLQLVSSWCVYICIIHYAHLYVSACLHEWCVCVCVLIVNDIKILKVGIIILCFKHVT